jgi:glycosyltransferase involved in cell wall biosynthesis
MQREAPSLAIVIPCYNEEEMLPQTFEVIDTLLASLVESEKISTDSKAYYVDDGSKDNTWRMLKAKAEVSKRVIAVRLSRNRGHQNALYAGLCATDEDAVVSIDADLQDNPENITKMVDAYLEGSDVVFGVRSERQTDTFFKRFTAEGYYRVMRKMGVDLVFNHADFRLMSRVVVNALKDYPETNLFLRGIIREIGFQSAIVSYVRHERAAGQSKYPLKKMLSFAWEGITSFTTAPLRIITIFGALASMISALVMIWVLLVWLFSGETVPGWASILLPLLFIGSVQLLCLGVVGEYIAKIYNEVKRRPKFHVSELVKSKNKS